MKPRLFIVDDEAPARSRLKTLLSDIAEDCPHELAGEAASAQDALDGIAATKPDIVLLDVQMPGMNGIELATHLVKGGTVAPAVIFVTAFDQFAVKAFEVHALDYLLKPVRATRLAEAIRRVDAWRTAPASQADAIAETGKIMQAGRQHFSVQERGRLLLVPVDDVLYLKAELKYVTLRTRKQDYLIEDSLTSIEEELGATFVRVHRNTLVARKAIIGVERGAPVADSDVESDKAPDSWQVILRDVEERLPISRRQWPVVKALVR
ncbi:MAG TPA: LytTR family DNA-binding domain-containing protein [Noviherbaspirillum sp.]|uniref:LytR/AlgR family response regulator transcription factor n=1 Tax=Noviherbaspirillum sp. TaxID=1926288 RepID=UPI002B49EC9E|nr:LytTR family DNA-binding domain-containing protein [Noviherbaspirillum sp.]HJV85559.1 LytTR family DNA-binding domain-containing protein [Noviherbaspirillum sp.]